LIDSNALVYAFDERSPHHAAAKAAVARWIEDRPAWTLAWQVVFEFLRVATHPAISGSPSPVGKAEAFVADLVESPGARVISPGPRHLDLYREASAEIGGARGNDVHDARLVALMREHGDDEILSADARFGRFRGIRLVDPRR
jgi:toxin-antitoxin system PIN domain toxin